MIFPFDFIFMSFIQKIIFLILFKDTLTYETLQNGLWRVKGHEWNLSVKISTAWQNLLDFGCQCL